MKIAGITAEYNPLHDGHQYHIRKTRQCTGADAIIALISSNFTQRGEPSIVDKRARAIIATACGADLVLELPCAFSCRNAGIFANAAVDILSATGVVNVISFGTEAGDGGVKTFEEIARVLNDEPVEFKETLKKNLDEGHSFVQSRSIALDELIPGALALLSTPNNNLALAYIKRIMEKKYAMETLHIQREGTGFHEKESKPGEFASASSVRAMIEREGAEAARGSIPDVCADILSAEIGGGHAVIGSGRLWRAVKQAALRSSRDDMSDIAEMREGMENRMRRAAYEASSLDEFVDFCTSRRYTAGRIKRYCVHLLLNLRDGRSKKFQERGPAYIRALAANSVGREVLRLMRKRATLPLLSKPGGRVTHYASEIMNFERSSSEMWETLTDCPRHNAESRMHAIMSEK